VPGKPSRAELSDLYGGAKVFRDAWGVPHLRAGDPLALAYLVTSRLGFEALPALLRATTVAKCR
jgi:hypothetical protein